MPKQYLFVNFQESILSCAVGIPDATKIHLQHVTHYSLNHGEYTHNTLFNPSAIQQHLQSFMQTYGLNNTSLIISLPRQSYDTNNFNLLQHALGLSKGKIVIASVVHAPHNLFSSPCLQKSYDQCPPSNLLSHNLLSKFLPHGYTKIAPWLIGFSLSTCVLMLGCFIAHTILQTQLTKIQHQINALESALKESHPLVQAANILEKKLNIVQQHANTLSPSNASTVPKLLKILAESIPANAYISQFSHNTSKDKTSPILGSYRIKGFAQNPETINQWLATLSQTDTPPHFFLVSLNRTKTTSTATDQSYSFVIQANA